MYKIFYNKDTLKIMGMCDKGKTMDFPFVTTTTYYHSLNNLKIVKVRGKYKVEPITPPPPLKVNYEKMKLYQKFKN